MFNKIGFIIVLILGGCAASTELPSESEILVEDFEIPADSIPPIEWCDFTYVCTTWANGYGHRYADLHCLGDFPTCPYWERNVCPRDLWGCMGVMDVANSCGNLLRVSECEEF